MSARFASQMRMCWSLIRLRGRLGCRVDPKQGFDGLKLKVLRSFHEQSALDSNTVTDVDLKYHLHNMELGITSENFNDAVGTLSKWEVPAVAVVPAWLWSRRLGSAGSSQTPVAPKRQHNSHRRHHSRRHLPPRRHHRHRRAAGVWALPAFARC